MEGRLVLKDCSIFRPDGRLRVGVAVVVENDRVVRVAPDDEVPVLPGDWEVACRGRLVMPGLVDCHTHLVGEQLLPSTGRHLMRSDPERFAIRQRLAQAMTQAELEALTAWGMARSLRNGVTLVAEHLEAPSSVEDSLETQARVALRLGMRAILSHATHSVNDTASGLAQLEANAAFVQRWRTDRWVRGALGFHASATCSDELLQRAGRLREEFGCGVHFHVAEHEPEEDPLDTLSRGGRRIVPRLEGFGLIGPGGVASYANAIDQEEAERLKRSRILVALHPMHPRTAAEMIGGDRGLESLLTHPPLLGLGTGGCGTLWQQLSAAFACALQLARAGRLADPDGLMAKLLIAGPAELLSMVFGLPSGNVEEGAVADLAVYDTIPAIEHPEEASSGLLMQLAEVPVAWTVVGGRVVVREGQLVGANHVELAHEAARALESLWRRVDVPASSR